jgi:hypothetical protein
VAAPLLVAIAIDRLDQRRRRLDRPGDAARERRAHDLLTQAGQIGVLAQPARAQQLVEAAAVELATGLEHRVLGDQRAQGVVGDGEAHVVRAQRDQPLSD